MKVGLYNRWVRTAGGGEKHSLALAELLRERADVDVIAPEPADLVAMGDRLRLRLDGVRMRLVEDDPAAVSRASADYDLFINATFMRLPASRAKRSMLLVFFPGEIFTSPWGLRKYRIAQQLARHLSFPRYGEGFYGIETTRDGRARWTDGNGRLRIHVPASGRRHIDLELRSPAGRQPVVVRCATAAHAWATEIQVEPTFAHHRVVLPEAIHGDVEVAVSSASSVPGVTGDTRVLGVQLRAVRASGMRNALYRLLFERVLPSRRYVFEDEDTHHAQWRALDTYDLVCANSQFTQGWVRRYWKRDAAILYPPVDVELLRPRPKQPLILSVGRFFTGGHCKRQDVLVRAFRQLAPRLPSGWRLVLAGGVGHRDVDSEFVASVRRAAQGLPIEVRTDVSAGELQTLYGDASLYWHATGYSEDGAPHPAALEHFGITTVEAMAAGCVPVVHGAGGQGESVEPGVSGYLWQTPEELIARSEALVHDPPRREAMSRAAVAGAQRFGRDAFDARATELLAPLLASR